MRLLLRSILSREGYPLHVAEHGAAALELLTAHPDIALLITDLDMPVMGGLELLAKVQGRSDLAKLVVSAHPLTEGALARHGVHACFEKPLDIRRFKGTVHALLNPHPAPVVL